MICIWSLWSEWHVAKVYNLSESLSQLVSWQGQYLSVGAETVQAGQETVEDNLHPRIRGQRVAMGTWWIDEGWSHSDSPNFFVWDEYFLS